jgi:hypothetical protein
MGKFRRSGIHASGKVTALEVVVKSRHYARECRGKSPLPVFDKGG